MSKDLYATSTYSNDILKKLNKHYFMEGVVFWASTKDAPFYKPINSIIGIKSFKKDVIHTFNLNRMQPSRPEHLELFAQFIIIDIAPKPDNPRKLDAISLYNDWTIATRNNKIIRERKASIEETGIYYIYNYDIEKIIKQVDLLGTKFEEGSRIIKKNIF